MDPHIIYVSEVIIQTVTEEEVHSKKDNSRVEERETNPLKEHLQYRIRHCVNVEIDRDNAHAHITATSMSRNHTTIDCKNIILYIITP